MSYRLQDYDFELPREFIAQRPVEPRDHARLFVVHRKTGRFEHRRFYEIPEYFQPGDLLVLNETRVIPARVYGTRETGGRVEILFLGVPDEDGTVLALVRSRGHLRDGERLRVGEVDLELLERTPEGPRRLRWPEEVDFLDFLNRHGLPPLPPYIKRSPAPEDRERYQTVFARRPGSVAAPTAGLHFTPRVLEALRRKGVEIRYLVLHVGLGTFRPIRSEDIRQHRMDAEYYEIPDEVAEALLRAKQEGRRVIGCGTTVTRALETWRLDQGPRRGWTRLFIYPPFEFRVLDALITNFHVPRSTPLLLVAAFMGRERLLQAYEEAKRLGYRFFSYGDAMLIL